MRRTTVVERGIASADALFSLEGIPEGAVVPEPEGLAATEAAVERLGSRFAGLDGQVRHALRRTRDHAGNLSSDRLQGLSEIVQNAEDLDATHVRILTKERELLVAHSGSPVRLPDETDALIGGRFRDHPHAEVILSMPGIGSVLAAEFIAHTGGDMSVFGTADRLAGVAGLAPVPKDSGRISGNMRRPRRYCRRLMRVFYMSAQVAARCCLVSKAYYERKRAEKKTHKQAVIALARRRLNVLWALLRDGRPFEGSPPLRAARLGSVKRAALSHIRW